MKRDIYKHRERCEKWKEEAVQMGVDGLSKKNSDILLDYLEDMTEKSD